MPDKKTTMLFGAGAVLDWGAPKTLCHRNNYECIPEHGSDKIKNRPCCFTHLITNIGFKDSNGKRISKKIFDHLEPEGDQGANFETIINIVEDLYSYWASKQTNTPKSLYSITSFDDTIDNFITDLSCSKTEYFENFLDELLGGIIGPISKYSYHTSGYSVINKNYNKDINDKFYQWCKTFIDNDHILRMYTLNYDRMFKVLLQDKDIDIFEGFNLASSEIKPGEEAPPDVSKIVTDFKSNVYYNLHGSAYWTIKKNDLGEYQYALIGVPDADVTIPSAKIEPESGKELLLTNMITGYKKVQKTSVSPFRQMFSAFDRDCLETDELYIIGYSFGDKHINDVIKTAQKHNNGLKITIVDPKIDYKPFKNLIPKRNTERIKEGFKKFLNQQVPTNK